MASIGESPHNSRRMSSVQWKVAVVLSTICPSHWQQPFLYGTIAQSASPLFEKECVLVQPSGRGKRTRRGVRAKDGYVLFSSSTGNQFCRGVSIASGSFASAMTYGRTYPRPRPRSIRAKTLTRPISLTYICDCSLVLPIAFFIYRGQLSGPTTLETLSTSWTTRVARIGTSSRGSTCSPRYVRGSSK